MQNRVSFEDYVRELEIHMNDASDLAREVRECKRFGPLVYVVAGMLEIEQPEDRTSRIAHTGDVFAEREIVLSGFGKLDHRPGEEPRLTVRQKIAIRQKNTIQRKEGHNRQSSMEGELPLGRIDDDDDPGFF